MITERPILFNAAMVRAVLDGSKTQTRRIVKLPKAAKDYGVTWEGIYRVQHTGNSFYLCDGEDSWVLKCPYGQPGSRRWVKETWCTSRCLDHCKPTDLAQGAGIQYRADGWNDGFGMSDPGKTRVAIFMRRWMSRILLEIVSVRVERLQDISEGDACWEGIDISANDCDYITTYRQLWQSINGPGSWDANPFVWVVEFKRVEGKS